jgi:uncharacterized protein (TIGR03435 family)
MMRLSAPFVLVVSLATASDVVSVIKPNRSGGAGGLLGVPSGDRFSAANVTVQALVAAAYGSGLPLSEERILGMPAWAQRDRFDVEARQEGLALAEEPADDEAVVAAFGIVRTVLADRFALRVHEESRQAPIYVLGRGSGLTTRLRPTKVDCEAILRAGPFGEVLDPDGRPLQPCAVRMRAGQITGTGATMAQLSRYLSRARGVELDVVDGTGLEGRFDFSVEWTPPLAPTAASDGTAPAAQTGPSIFTALQEQLGLKLDASRGQVRVLVIDRVDRPTPN